MVHIKCLRALPQFLPADTAHSTIWREEDKIPSRLVVLPPFIPLVVFILVWREVWWVVLWWEVW